MFGKLVDHVWRISFKHRDDHWWDHTCVRCYTVKRGIFIAIWLSYPTRAQDARVTDTTSESPSNFQYRSRIRDSAFWNPILDSLKFWKMRILDLWFSGTTWWVRKEVERSLWPETQKHDLLKTAFTYLAYNLRYNTGMVNIPVLSVGYHSCCFWSWCCIQLQKNACWPNMNICRTAVREKPSYYYYTIGDAAYVRQK